MNEVIELLADKFGIAVTELMGYYMAQVPAEWIDVALWLVLAAFISFVVMHVNRRLAIADPDDAYIWVPATVGGGVIMLLVLVGAVFDLSEAVRATLSPEAYAIDRILKHL